MAIQGLGITTHDHKDQKDPSALQPETIEKLFKAFQQLSQEQSELKQEIRETTLRAQHVAEEIKVGQEEFEQLGVEVDKLKKENQKKEETLGKTVIKALFVVSCCLSATFVIQKAIDIAAHGIVPVHFSFNASYY
jgi:hypothetical protein